jgi:hypothetical protein
MCDEDRTREFRAVVVKEQRGTASNGVVKVDFDDVWS